MKKSQPIPQRRENYKNHQKKERNKVPKSTMVDKLTSADRHPDIRSIHTERII